VHLGDFGWTGDGEIGLSTEANNGRFVAISTYSGGNAGGGSAGLVKVIDLKRGKIVTSVSGTTMDVPFGVQKLTMNADGRIGWTTQEIYDDEKDGRLTEVLSAVPGRPAQRLAVGMRIDPQFLRFDKDHRSLIWSDKAGSGVYTPRTIPKPPAKKRRGHCLKRGERIYFEQAGTVLIKRPTKRPGRTKSFDLIACAGGLKARHVVGHFGDESTRKHELANKSVNSRFVAIVTRTSSKPSGQSHDVVRVFELIHGREISHDFATPQLGDGGDPTGVTAVQLSDDGSVAWIVRHGPKRCNAQCAYSVTIHDQLSLRVLDSSPTIDPYFLRFDQSLRAVHWAQKIGTGTSH
jgi:hypothetical protein